MDRGLVMTLMSAFLRLWIEMLIEDGIFVECSRIDG